MLISSAFLKVGADAFGGLTGAMVGIISSFASSFLRISIAAME